MLHVVVTVADRVVIGDILQFHNAPIMVDCFTWKAIKNPRRVEGLRVINKGKPPALPEDSQSLTFAEVYQTPCGCNTSLSGEVASGVRLV